MPNIILNFIRDEERELSKREQEILQLVVKGYTNAQIGLKLNISENTVKAHMQSIFAKLKVRSRTQAAMHAVQQGWVSTGSSNAV
jgi:DNA-binding NarL/FixJ family response regulator